MQINNQQLGLMKIPFRDYCEINAINNSKLKDFFDDQKLFYRQHIAKTVPLDSEARHFIVGRAIHCLVLEPEKFSTEFMVGDYRKSSKAGLANLELAKAGGYSLISEDELQMVESCAAELPNQDEWCKNLAGAINVHVEVTIVIQIGGITLKVMLDKCIEHADVVYIDDVKSTSKSNESDFDDSITEYHYILQYAFYRFVAEKYFKKRVVMRFVFCSKNQPFNIAFIVMNDQHYAVGYDVVDKTLTMFIEAQKTGIWYKEQVAEREAVISKYQMQKYLKFLEGK